MQKRVRINDRIAGSCPVLYEFYRMNFTESSEFISKNILSSLGGASIINFVGQTN